MDDLFSLMEKKMEELHHSHAQIISLMETFKNSMNQKETVYRNKFEELKTLFDIFKQYKNITSSNNKDDIREVTSKFSNTSLHEVGLIEQLSMEKSKDCCPPSTSAASNQSFISTSLVSQISEHFSRNPTLAESPKLVDESFYSTDRHNAVRNTSSPMFSNSISSNNYKENYLKYTDSVPFDTSKSRANSRVVVDQPIYEGFVTPVKPSFKMDTKKDERNSSNEPINTKSCTVATIGSGGISSENLSDSSCMETDDSFGSTPSSVYSSRRFYDKANSYSFISPLSSVRSSRAAFSTLHYFESNLVIDDTNNCLAIRKPSKFSGDLEQVVVEKLINVKESARGLSIFYVISIKHWKPKHVLQLRARFDSYFCRRLYNSQRVCEIRKIIKECERIHRTIGDTPNHEDNLLAKAIAADIKLHKDIVHNIFFETTLNSKLVMINEVLEKVERPANHSRAPRRQKYIPLNRNNQKSIAQNCPSSPLNQSNSSFLINAINKSSDHPNSSSCIYTESLSQKSNKFFNHFSKSSR